MKEDTYFEAVHKIITAGHMITDSINRLLKSSGSTEPQYNVLQILSIKKDEALTVDQIQDGMVQRNSNVSRIVDKLLANGLVTRIECAENRRKKDIKITKEGLEYLKELNLVVEYYHSPMMEKLEKKELESLKFLISKLTSD